jgi:hypothetical protein
LDNLFCYTVCPDFTGDRINIYNLHHNIVRSHPHVAHNYYSQILKTGESIPLDKAEYNNLDAGKGGGNCFADRAFYTAEAYSHHISTDALKSLMFGSTSIDKI